MIQPSNTGITCLCTSPYSGNGLQRVLTWTKPIFIGPCKGGSMDSRFKFQKDCGFEIQIWIGKIPHSNYQLYKIPDLKFLIFQGFKFQTTFLRFIFEPTCAYAWWAHMHRFLYVCDLTKIGERVRCIVPLRVMGVLKSSLTASKMYPLLTYTS